MLLHDIFVSIYRPDNCAELFLINELCPSHVARNSKAHALLALLQLATRENNSHLN